jgi:hypothetical protein
VLPLDDSCFAARNFDHADFNNGNKAILFIVHFDDEDLTDSRAGH